MMKMKSFLKHYGALVLFLLALSLPALLMPFSKDNALEKRETAGLPRLFAEGSLNRDFGEEMDNWLSEHMGLRNTLISWENSLERLLLGQTAESDVIVGSDGWLFYRETLADYLHQPTLTQRSANSAARSLQLVQDYAAARGAELLFVSPLNKNTLYGEYMPSRYKQEEAQSNRELLLAALEEAGVPYVDLLPVFQASEETLYRKTDTHWSYAGAFAAYEAIEEALGRELFAGAETLTFEADPAAEADLLSLLGEETGDRGDELAPVFDFGYRVTSHQKSVDAVTLTTACDGGEGKLLVYRDSFCNTLQVYLAESFEECLFSRSLPYNLSLLDTTGADTVIVELAERNLAQLASQAPLMEAPQADAAAFSSAVRLPAGAATLQQEESGSLTHYYGTVDEDLLGDSYRVYVLRQEDGELAAYEAFPVFEQELLGAEDLQDNGWSLYLPAGEEPEAVVVESQGRKLWLEL